MQIGFSTHLFVYETLCPLWIQKIKEYGFEWMEIWGMRPHFDYRDKSSVSRIRDFIQKENIRAVSFHAPFYMHVKDAKEGKWISISSREEEERQKTLGEIKEVMDVMCDFGADIMALHCGLKINREGNDPPEALYRSIDELLSHAGKKRVRIALENAPNEYSTTEKILSIVEKYDSESLGLCLDLGHANVIEDPVSAIKIASGHILSIHASDNDGIEDSHHAPFFGNIKWEKVREALALTGYDGPFILELRNYGDYVESLSQAKDSVEKIFK